MAKQCPVIEGLKFDQKSLDSLAEIKRKVGTTQLGVWLTGVGVMGTIFYRNGPLGAAYNIYQTDWALFATAVKAWPDIARREIGRVANEALLDHPSEPKQRRFWEAVTNGCQP
ncbi:hypothetical protein HA052_23515 [Chromobacterium haemolyticum]|uniref:Uncharacterized protein n=1 Tax=Chromobacterium fluminis TaxID=3044269 RepID=A0ABX0L961_9NEIS|nr:hypothetical protein [Chromobacterium haemolyticum]NHR08164.1 hypothetical protein [Chromobacterium haemolyticum]